jgi:WASH complex subunit strumpellin
MNKALIRDVRAHYTRPESKPYPGDEILADLTKYLEAAGINDPITKIYATSDTLEFFPVVMFLFVVAQTSRLQHNKRFSKSIFYFFFFFIFFFLFYFFFLF